ncbi:MAG: RNA pseudouridine synthase, partial [Cytophagales bacterium]|nr:RNA pseudouridine synthase [Cytophagales bacterium]
MPLQFHDLVIHETEDFIFINKPYGVSSLEDRTSPTPSILQMARTAIPTAILSHRLDKETSGVMAIAKSEAAYRHSSILFEHRKVDKVYHAFVNGTHKFENKEVDVPLLTLNNGKVVTDPKDGKPSTTVFNTLKAFKFVTLVQCQPLTGRMHQIRVHMAY